MDKSRITAAIWSWGTDTREEMELAAKEISAIGYTSFESVKAAIYAYDLDLNAYRQVLDKYNLTPASFYFLMPAYGEEAELFGNLERELEFITELGVKRICLQATEGRPAVMDSAALDYELSLIQRFSEKTQKFGIVPNLHPHYNTWVMYQEEIDCVFKNLDSNTIQFAPDTAHLVAAGCDPVAVIKKYIDRVNFTHFKDIKAQPNGYAAAGKSVYTNFCELGTGCIDFRSIFDVLKAANYDGPLCEELDFAPVSNAESAKNNFNFLLNNY